MARIAALELAMQLEVPKRRDDALLHGRSDIGIVGEILSVVEDRIARAVLFIAVKAEMLLGRQCSGGHIGGHVGIMGQVKASVEQIGRGRHIATFESRDAGVESGCVRT